MPLNFVALSEIEQAVDSHCRPAYGAEVLGVTLELAQCASMVHPGWVVFVFLGLKWYRCEVL